MTLYNLLKECQAIADSHEDVQYSNIGHEWDIAAQKIDYMAVWFETPVRITYLRSETKQYTLAVNVLQLCSDYNDYDEVLQATSDAEDVGDDLIHALVDMMKSYKVMATITDVDAVTLRHFTTKDLVGVKYDITFNTQSNYCSYPAKLNTP